MPRPRTENPVRAPVRVRRLRHIGARVEIVGRPSHQTVDNALMSVERLENQAGRDAAGDIGDRVGVMALGSRRFFRR